MDAAPPAPPRWDLFCRVIDNHGDLGVCWRLGQQLARRGCAVRLVVDDPSALAWMAPADARPVQVLRWTTPAPDLGAPADVVVEAFGCDPPPAHVQAMAAVAAVPGARPPLWLNLEYLSAEAYVERSHGLRSPQWSGPGRGLDKWFFYPGFSAATGGLMYTDAPGAPALADTLRWLAAQGVARAPGERVALVFNYDNPRLPALLAGLGDRPTALWLCPGAPQRALPAAGLPPALRCLALPHVDQPRFDALLALSDLNLVRGEDSCVRAQVVADAPWLWQIYPQDDGAHAAKLDALAERLLHGAAPAAAASWRAALRALAGTGPVAPLHWDTVDSWRPAQARWRAGLRARPDLADALLHFAAARGAPTPPGWTGAATPPG